MAKARGLVVPKRAPKVKAVSKAAFKAAKSAAAGRAAYDRVFGAKGLSSGLQSKAAKAAYAARNSPAANAAAAKRGIAKSKRATTGITGLKPFNKRVAAAVLARAFLDGGGGAGLLLRGGSGKDG